MKRFFNTLQKDAVLLWTFWVTIIVIIAMVITIGLFYTTLPPFVPLYNHMPWGYDRLGRTYELFIPSIVVSIVGIINVSLGIRLMDKTPLLARFLFLTMAGLALFTFIFIGRLIFITL